MRIKIKKIILLSLLCFISACTAPFHFVNYFPWNTPRFSYLVNPPFKGQIRDKIKIVSYNIKHSHNIDKAIELLKENPDLANADILLLQEMVPQAVEKISSQLNYNYIFYPAVLHPILKDNFGNAILSKWPITYDNNIIFPSAKKKARHRVAVAAKIIINNEDVLVYSLHMGVFMKPIERKKQIQGILDSIPEDINYCIIGGDFNTIKEKDQKTVIKTFIDAGFEHATSKVKWTFNHWYLMNYKSTFDHIFVRGPKVLRADSVNNREASDHLPIWAEIEISSDK